MFTENKFISIRQFIVVLVFFSINSTWLFLPSELAKINGNSSLVVLFMWLVVFIFLGFLLVNLKIDFKEIYFSIFGNTIGQLISVFLGAGLIFYVSMEVRIFSEIVVSYMLPSTPLYIILGIIMLLSFYLSYGGIETLSRCSEILAYFVFIPLLVLLVTISFSVDFTKALPIKLPTFKDIYIGGISFTPYFQPLFFLGFAFPYLKIKNTKDSNIIKYTIIVFTLITFFVFLLCFGIYGTNLLSQKLFPTIQMLERIGFNDFFLIRQDIFVIWFWFASTLIFTSCSLIFLYSMGNKILNKDNNHYLFFIVTIFIVAYLPRDLTTVYEWKNIITPWINILFFAIFPLIICRLNKKKKGENNEQI